MRAAVRFSELNEVPPLPPKLNTISSPRGRKHFSVKIDESSVVSDSSRSTAGSDQEDHVARLNLAGRTPHSKQIQSHNNIELLKENLLFTDNFSFAPPEMKFHFASINSIKSLKNTTTTLSNPLSDISNNIAINQTEKTKKDNVNILQTVGIAERKSSNKSKKQVLAVVSTDENNENDENNLNVSIVSPPSDLVGQSMEQIANSSMDNNNSRIIFSNSMHVMESGGSHYNDDEELLNTSTATTKENKGVSRPNSMLSVPQTKVESVQRKRSVSNERTDIVVVSSKPSLQGRRANSPSLNNASSSNNTNVHDPASVLARNKLLVSNLQVDSSAISPYTPSVNDNNNNTNEGHVARESRHPITTTESQVFFPVTFTESHAEQSYINQMLLGSQDSKHSTPASDITIDDMSNDNNGGGSSIHSSPKPASSSAPLQKHISPEANKVNNSPPSDSDNSGKSVKIFQQGGVSLRGRGPSPGPSHRMSASFIDPVPMCAVINANQVIGKPYSNQASSLMHPSNSAANLNNSTNISVANRSICSEARSISKPLMSQKAMNNNTVIDKPSVKGTTPKTEKKRPPTMPSAALNNSSNHNKNHVDKKDNKKRENKTSSSSIKPIVTTAVESSKIDKRRVSPATSVVSSLTEPQFEVAEKVTRPKTTTTNTSRDLGKPQRSVSNQRRIYKSVSSEAMEESISLRQKDIIHELLIRPDNYLGDLFTEKFNNFNEQPDYTKIGYSDDDSCISTIESSLCEALGGRKLSPPVETKSSPIFMSYRKIQHASDSENDEVELGLSELLQVDSMGMMTHDEIYIKNKNQLEVKETFNPIASKSVSPKKTMSQTKSKNNSLCKSSSRKSLGSAQRITRRQAEIDEIKAIEVPRSVQKINQQSIYKSNKSKIFDESPDKSRSHNSTKYAENPMYKKKSSDASKSMISFANDQDTINTEMAVLPEENTYVELNSCTQDVSLMNLTLAETTMTLDHSYLLNSSGLFTMNPDDKKTVEEKSMVPRMAIKSLARNDESVPDVKEITFCTVPGQYTTIKLGFCNKQEKILKMKTQTIPIRFESIKMFDNNMILPPQQPQMESKAQDFNSFEVFPNIMHMAPGESGCLYVTFSPLTNLVGNYSGALKIKYFRKSFLLLLRGEARYPVTNIPIEIFPSGVVESAHVEKIEVNEEENKIAKTDSITDLNKSTQFVTIVEKQKSPIEKSVFDNDELSLQERQQMLKLRIKKMMGESSGSTSPITPALKVMETNVSTVPQTVDGVSMIAYDQESIYYNNINLAQNNVMKDTNFYNPNLFSSTKSIVSQLNDSIVSHSNNNNYNVYETAHKHLESLLETTRIKTTSSIIEQHTSSKVFDLEVSDSNNKGKSMNNITQQQADALNTTQILDNKTGVFFRKTNNHFGSVVIGSLSRSKIELCNSTDDEVLVYLGDPCLPFVLLHNEVSLKPRSYVRVPVRFLPVTCEDFTAELVAQTSNGLHHTSITLTGSAHE